MRKIKTCIIFISGLWLHLVPCANNRTSETWQLVSDVAQNFNRNLFSCTWQKMMNFTAFYFGKMHLDKRCNLVAILVPKTFSPILQRRLSRVFFHWQSFARCILLRFNLWFCKTCSDKDTLCLCMPGVRHKHKASAADCCPTCNWIDRTVDLSQFFKPDKYWQCRLHYVDVHCQYLSTIFLRFTIKALQISSCPLAIFVNFISH